VQILGANAGATAEVLRGVRDDLDEVLAALEAAASSALEVPGGSSASVHGATGAAAGTPWRRTLAETLAGGNAGVARIPGKHGQDRRYAQLVVMVDDRPGELARLLTELGEDGVNLEDLRLEHSPGAQIGLAEIAVLPETLDTVTSALAARGWRIAG
jgi:prephenate dehydrogenase